MCEGPHVNGSQFSATQAGRGSQETQNCSNPLLVPVGRGLPMVTDADGPRLHS